MRDKNKKSGGTIDLAKLRRHRKKADDVASASHVEGTKEKKSSKKSSKEAGDKEKKPRKPRKETLSTKRWRAANRLEREAFGNGKDFRVLSDGAVKDLLRDMTQHAREERMDVDKHIDPDGYKERSKEVHRRIRISKRARRFVQSEVEYLFHRIYEMARDATRLTHRTKSSSKVAKLKGSRARLESELASLDTKGRDEATKKGVGQILNDFIYREDCSQRIMPRHMQFAIDHVKV